MSRTRKTITQQPRGERQAFRPRMDLFVFLVACFFIGCLLVSIPLVMWVGGGVGVTQVGLALFFAILAIYYIDAFFYSSYVLEEEGLLIQSKIRHILLPYRSMRDLRSGGFRWLISFASHKRFALARSNLVLRLHGMPWKSVSLSPADKDGFINSLLAHIEYERSTRVRRSHLSVQK